MRPATLKFTISLSLLLTVAVTGILGIMHFEGMSFSEAFYFAIVTMSTVGYGDLSPQSAPGRILAMVMIITGVGTFMTVVAEGADMLMASREDHARKEKLSMVRAIFFNELGRALLALLCRFDAATASLSPILRIPEAARPDEIRIRRRHIETFTYRPDITEDGLCQLQELLESRSDLLLRLLEHPQLLEHQEITDLLWSIVHVRDELGFREPVEEMEEEDVLHLANDLRRAFGHLSSQWILYLVHLKEDYPYLFRLADWKSPFAASSGMRKASGSNPIS